MITDFEGCRNISDTEDIRRYLYELCEKLNVAFSFLESEIAKCVKYDNGTAQPESISVNGGEAEIGSSGEVLCKSVKANTLDIFTKADIEDASIHNLFFPNGVQLSSTGIRLKELWSADSSSEYVTTGDCFILNESAENYRFFFARISNSAASSDGNTYIPCIKLGRYLRGIEGYCTDNELNIFICAMTLDENTAEIGGSKIYFPLTGRFENRKLTRFYAVI